MPYIISLPWYITEILLQWYKPTTKQAHIYTLVISTGCTRTHTFSDTSLTFLVVHQWYWWQQLTICCKLFVDHWVQFMFEMYGGTLDTCVAAVRESGGWRKMFLSLLMPLFSLDIYDQIYSKHIRRISALHPSSTSTLSKLFHPTPHTHTLRHQSTTIIIFTPPTHPHSTHTC